MGYEYYLANPRTHELMILGKGRFTSPIEDVSKSIHTGEEKTTEDFVFSQRRLFKREMLGKTKEEFIETYRLEMLTGENGYDDADPEYLNEIAAKMWDWCGEDEVWYMGDAQYDYLDGREWYVTASRYIEHCADCKKEINTIFKERKEGLGYRGSFICGECWGKG